MKKVHLLLLLAILLVVPSMLEAQDPLYDELTGYWTILREEVCPLTDQIELLFGLPCNESITDFPSKSDIRVLYIYLRDGTPDIVVAWNDYLGDNNTIRIAFRFDDGEVEEQLWIIATNKLGLFFPGGQPELKMFVRLLIGSESFIVGVTPEGKRRQVATFDVRGLGNVLLPYLEYFGWEDLEEEITAVSVDEEQAMEVSVLPLVLLERGSFTMGDTRGDGRDNENPTHRVTFTYDFYIGKHEVTFSEYDTFCDATGRSRPDDRGWGRGARPVINVTWWDAIAYCNWLSEKEGLPVAYRLRGEPSEGQMLDANRNVTRDITKVVGYRLPTEAEWEYAARGGNKSEGYKYAGSDTVGDVAWYRDNSLWGTEEWGTREVGRKAPNELGIYDMTGNVWEWCCCRYASYNRFAKTNPYNAAAGSILVIRGGGWRNSALDVRVAIRIDRGAPYKSNYLGFRIARTAH